MKRVLFDAVLLLLVALLSCAMAFDCRCPASSFVHGTLLPVNNPTIWSGQWIDNFLSGTIAMCEQKELDVYAVCQMKWALGQPTNFTVWDASENGQEQYAIALMRSQYYGGDPVPCLCTLQ